VEEEQEIIQQAHRLDFQEQQTREVVVEELLQTLLVEVIQEDQEDQE
jgi:hypothetical protein